MASVSYCQLIIVWLSGKAQKGDLNSTLGITRSQIPTALFVVKVISITARMGY